MRVCVCVVFLYKLLQGLFLSSSPGPTTFWRYFLPLISPSNMKKAPQKQFIPQKNPGGRGGLFSAGWFWGANVEHSFVWQWWRQRDGQMYGAGGRTDAKPSYGLCEAKRKGRVKGRGLSGRRRYPFCWLIQAIPMALLSQPLRNCSLTLV